MILLCTSYGCPAFFKQKNQQANGIKNAVITRKEALLNDVTSPFTGLKTAKVNVIEFFDYQCVYCSKVLPAIEKMQKEFPNVKFIYKETPIFSKRWEASKYAAQIGLDVFAQRGSKAYADYHNGIYATGLNEGKLTTTVIEKKAILAGLDISKFKATDVYVKNLQLFSQLGFRGTPAFIIMPTDNVTLDNIFIVNGADENSVREAIKTLSK